MTTQYSWLGAVWLSKAHAELGEGKLPYGQLRTVMCPGSSKSFWYGLSPRILDLNSVSNQGRDGESIGWLREMFFLDDPLPVYNLEPYYPGMDVNWHPKPMAGMTDGQMAQFLMYGCVLNGGALAGHAWGDCYWGGAATHAKRPVTKGDPHKNGFNRWTAASMGKLKDFVLDGGHDYRVLAPAVKNLDRPRWGITVSGAGPGQESGAWIRQRGQGQLRPCRSHTQRGIPCPVVAYRQRRLAGQHGPQNRRRRAVSHAKCSRQQQARLGLSHLESP